MGATDAEVIDSSLAEPLRFALIFDRYAEPIRRFAVARVGSAADDVTAEVFRIAFERRATFDLAVPNARPWLYGIATNVVRRERRDRARGIAALERIHHRRDPMGDPLLDVAGRLDAQSRADQLRDAVLALGEHERELLLLVAWDQLSPTEAAHALGIPAETARTRLFRARQRVRAHLATNPEVPSDATP
ncbi:MAG TPA: sigma-70 family RNA polymerase sigma factor [Ilumatobacter sp.]|nr:sigma-70 family RNA polymerase sigma factor [Ilumatobacter sp.]